MKKIISVVLVAVMLCLSLSALVSCGAPEDGGPQISVYLGNEVFDFDPTDYYVDDNAAELMSLLFEPLFAINAKGKLVNAGAESYSVDEAEREIVISLADTYWSDKIRVCANDYIYAWRNILLNPDNASPAAALLYDIENAVAVKNGADSLYEFGAVASDTYEITITYREGADYRQLLKNLASVATSPIRQEYYENVESYWTKQITTICTNGAFAVSSINRDEGLFTIARNVGYHQSPTAVDYTKQVTPDKLVSFIVGEAITEINYSDLTDKTVFYLGDAPLSERAANAANAKKADLLSTYCYVFNTNHPLLAIKEVRQALSMVIDREAIAAAVTFGKAATGFLPGTVLDTATGKTFGTGDLISTSSKLNEAKALLQGVDLSGVDLSITLTVNDDEESIAIANLVKTAWENLGVGITVTVSAVGCTTSEIVDFTTGETIEINDSTIQSLVKSAAYGKVDYDVIAVDWQMYSQDAFVALSAFSHAMGTAGFDSSTNTSRENITSWWSFEYDTLMNAAYSETDKAARSEYLHEAEKYLVNSAPIVPILFNQNFAFVSSDLSGLTVDGFGFFSFTRVNQKNYKQYLPKED